MLVLYPLAGFCCWLLWLCTWMHQWHPLLCPIYEGEGSRQVGAARHLPERGRRRPPKSGVMRGARRVAVPGKGRLS